MEKRKEVNNLAGINDGNPIGGDDLASFLVIGQSNMAGRGNIDEVEPIENFRCYMLRNGRFIRMSEPLNVDRGVFGTGFKSGIGLAPSFANEYANTLKKRIGLIPCADGGTSVSEWQPGEILYDHAVFMTRLAMRNSSFSGFLWHQGENDACDKMSSGEYRIKLINFINSIRRELGAENLPFIMGELSEKISEQRIPTSEISRINEVIREVADFLPLCAVVSAEGLSLKSDGLHFNSASLREFGKRYFSVYKGVAKL